MIATLLGLQVIELGVMHLLLMLWNPTIAWIALALSLWGLIWTIALLKSFRINPVLVSGRTLRVRNGLLYDFTVARDDIIIAEAGEPEQAGEGAPILDLAILSSPNVFLRFRRPVAIRTFLGGERQIGGVGLKLDDSAAFLEDLRRSRQRPLRDERTDASPAET